MESKTFYSHGKLLLTGEYLVLDGAKALAVPCNYGQSLEVKPTRDENSSWTSYDHEGKKWLDIEFNLSDVIDSKIEGQNEFENRLFQILKETYVLNSEAFDRNYEFTTHLEFPRDWGLGTSSTLIANVAEWAKVDPYHLLKKTFGGSGYDIACANSKSALVYSIENEKPKVEKGKIPEALKPYLYFVHLGEKQNSREAISNYKAIKPSNLENYISEINKITQNFQEANSFQEGKAFVEHHENLLSEVLGLKPLKSRLFQDFDGTVKSLGAWGGDFIMVLSKTNPENYFRRKGYFTILDYKKMIL